MFDISVSSCSVGLFISNIVLSEAGNPAGLTYSISPKSLINALDLGSSW